MPLKEEVRYDFMNEKLNSFIFTQPTRFIYNKKEYEVETWVDLIDMLCELFKHKNQQKMNEFLEDEKNRENRIAYLAKNEQEIHFVKYLHRSDLYLNQKIDAPRSVKLLRKMLEKYNVCDNFTLYVRPY